MSVVWAISIKCHRCPATYGPTTATTTVGAVGYILRSFRREATAAGWATRRGARNRLLDFCPACSREDAG